MSERLLELTTELKNYIGQFTHRSFVAQWCFHCNAHWRQQTKDNQLRSPVRQMMYLLSLYHQTPFQGKERYTGFGKQQDKIIHLLNEIESCYTVDLSEMQAQGLSEEEGMKRLIAHATFLNYYLNAPLSFMEQDIERIQQTFRQFEPYILEETGLVVKDFIDFFLLVTKLEIEKYNYYYQAAFSKADMELAFRFAHQPKSLSDEQILYLSHLTEDAVFGLGIPMDDFKAQLGEDKALTLFVLFTTLRDEKEEILYYSDPCEYLRKPLMTTNGYDVVLLYSRQLISAIYEYLFELCVEMDSNGRKVYKRREDYLEEKTAEVVDNFFGAEVSIYKNYNVNGDEKDLLVLAGKYAYIIECKANKYRIPFRDPVRAYERIKDDFQKCIGKGYEQAKAVEDLFYGENSFDLRNDRGKVIATIDPGDFEEVFTIVVTQERFGQIQCDLSYLLNIAEDENYPWAVFIDDLETFLITLKRKRNYLTELPAFLLAREQLHSRVVCYDELELCSYFLFDREKFIRNCSREEFFISQPDANLTFDLLYQVGFGFKNEANLADKLKRRNKKAAALVKFHQLRPAENVLDYQNNSSFG